MLNDVLSAIREKNRTTKGILGIVLILLSMATLAYRIQLAGAESETIMVPDDYSTIQEAIDAASPGDTVYVKAGTYYENVEVTKAIHLTGEDAKNTIVDGTVGGTVIDLADTSNVIIERFTIRGTGAYMIMGHGGDNHIVRMNILQPCGAGGHGIEFRGSNGNNIYNNNITQVGNVTSVKGIELCEYTGLPGCNFNFIYGNHIEGNSIGIEIDSSQDNTIHHNNFVNNENRSADVNPGSCINFWNTTYPSGGNYWSDYIGTDEKSGINQSQPGSDGIGDTPYLIVSDNIDYLPLMSQIAHDVAVISVTASPTEAYDGHTVNVTVVVENQGSRVKETFDVTAYYGDTPIGTQPVDDLPAGENTTLTFQWDTHNIPEGNYTVKAEAEDVGPLETETGDNILADCTVEIHQTVRYMQNAKWDATYWKLLWNNTSTSASEARWCSGLVSTGYLGVKVYKGTTCLSGDSVVPVGAWLVNQDTLKSTTWGCGEQNVTGTYVKVEIWYKLEGYSWTSMGVAFKTQAFTQHTILNATTWTIYLYGRVYQVSPLGPPIQKTYITFHWGSSSKESRIEGMAFSACS